MFCVRCIHRFLSSGILLTLRSQATTSFRSTGMPKAYSQDQALERVLSVFVLPQDSPSFPNNPAGQPRRHRRLDLIFAPIDVYWCAVIGWCAYRYLSTRRLHIIYNFCRSGSIMFERDLRSWCKHKKYTSRFQYNFG